MDLNLGKIAAQVAPAVEAAPAEPVEAELSGTEVSVGDEVFDLAALAGVDMSEVQEVRSFALAAGMFHFAIKDAELKSQEVTKDDVKVNKPVVGFDLEVMDCLGLIDEKLDPASTIGRKHIENFWITDLAQDLGRVKAFLTDIGLDSNKPLTELLTEAHGHEFVASISNVKDKNDPDRIYANMKKPMSIAAYQEKMAA